MNQCRRFNWSMEKILWVLKTLWSGFYISKDGQFSLKLTLALTGLQQVVMMKLWNKCRPNFSWWKTAAYNVPEILDNVELSAGSSHEVQMAQFVCSQFLAASPRQNTHSHNIFYTNFSGSCLSRQVGERTKPRLTSCTWWGALMK